MRKFLLACILLLIFACNHTHDINSHDKRIVVTSPELAETIAIINPSVDIVGVTIECDYPTTLQSIYKVGSFGKIDIEKIIRLNPTHIFTTGHEQDLINAELQKLSLPVHPIFINEYSDYPNVIREIGSELSVQAKADSLAKWIETELTNFKKNTFSFHPKVYVEIYGSPIMTVNKNSLVGELIQIAGGENIFNNLPRPYCRINAEEVIKANPDIILLLYPNVKSENVKNRKGWNHIEAVINEKIFSTEDIDTDMILRATPRTIQGIQKMEKLFHEK